jgi:hypothetical protein
VVFVTSIGCGMSFSDDSLLSLMFPESGLCTTACCGHSSVSNSVLNFQYQGRYNTGISKMSFSDDSLLSLMFPESGLCTTACCGHSSVSNSVLNFQYQGRYNTGISKM